MPDDPTPDPADQTTEPDPPATDSPRGRQRRGLGVSWLLLAPLPEMGGDPLW